MRALWYERGIPVCIALTLLLGVAGFLRTWQDIGRPFGGYIAAFNPVINAWVVDRSTPGWWPVMNSGDRLHSEQDVLLEIDGRPYGFGQAEVFAASYTRQPPVVQLLVNHNGERRTIPVLVVPFTLAHFVDAALPNLLIGFSFWLVAMVAYRAQPTGALNRIFALYCCLLAAYIWLNSIGVFWQEEITAKLLALIHSAFLYALACGATLDFALLFPKPARFRHPFVIYVIYSLTAIYSLTYAASYLLFWQSGWTPWVAQLYQWAIYGASYLGISGTITLFIRLLWTLLNKSSPLREKRQAGLLLSGISIVVI